MILKNVEMRWAKILGEPRDKYEPSDGKEWSCEFVLQPEHVEALKAAGVHERYIKEKDGTTYIKYSRDAERRDGTAAKPIRVIAADGFEWDQNKLIGNGSLVDVQYIVNVLAKRAGLPERGKMAVLAIKVNELVPYEQEEQFELSQEGTTVREDWASEE